MTARPPDLARESFPLILAAPSGAGKTTIARELARQRADVEFSVSWTTRPPRPGEVDGRDYHFRTEAEFRAEVEAGGLLEWAEVHGQLYGTPRANLEEARRRRHLLLLDIDVQGSRQVKRTVPEAVSIFVLPPTAEELSRRLRGRGSEAEDALRRRLLTARGELEAAAEFDYLIVNDNLPDAVAAVQSIIEAEWNRSIRARGLQSFVANLVAGIDASMSG